MKLFLKLLHGSVVQKLLHELLHAKCQAKVLGAVWAMLGAIKSLCSWCCMQLSCTSCLAKLFLKLLRGAKAALQNYFLSLCMELLFKTCSSKLICELSHGTVVQKLSCEVIAEAFARNCRSKAALRNYFLSFCVELSYKGCFARLFHKLLHGAVVQNMPV